MKKVYLVKKNPDMPAESENWIIMNSYDFAMFIQTPEGKRRRVDFGQLDGCDMTDVIIIAECGKELANEWRKAVNRNQYTRILESQNDSDEVSYHALPSEYGDSIPGEEGLEDRSIDVEQTVMERIMKEELYKAILSLSEEDQDLIKKLYLIKQPMTELEYARHVHSTRDQIHEKKRTALRRLKKILGSDFFS